MATRKKPDLRNHGRLRNCHRLARQKRVLRRTHRNARAAVASRVLGKSAYAERAMSNRGACPRSRARCRARERDREIIDAPSVSRFRFVRAYRTTFAVISSYLWLSFKARFYGETYRRERIRRRPHEERQTRARAPFSRCRACSSKSVSSCRSWRIFCPKNFAPSSRRCKIKCRRVPYEEIRARIEKRAEKADRRAVRQRARRAHCQCVARSSARSASQRRYARGREGAALATSTKSCKLDLKTIRRIMGIVQWFVPVQGLDAYYLPNQRPIEGKSSTSMGRPTISKESAKNFGQDDSCRFSRFRFGSSPPDAF